MNRQRAHALGEVSALWFCYLLNHICFLVSNTNRRRIIPANPSIPVPKKAMLDGSVLLGQR